VTGRADADRGSATVLVLALCLVVALAGGVVATLGTVAVARHRAESAADLAALAAADRAASGVGPACAAASSAAVAVGARLLRCGLDGDVAMVTVAVRAAGPAAGLGTARATARAGPAARGTPEPVPAADTS